MTTRISDLLVSLRNLNMLWVDEEREFEARLKQTSDFGPYF